MTAEIRMGIDTGGTFTDLAVEEDGMLELYKAPTTPEDPVVGVLEVIEAAARRRACSVEALLARCSLLMHGTTRALNAVLTGTTARTALLLTRGHPDVLVLREGGRPNAFAHAVPYPAPYVPRRLTFEVPERVDVHGRVVEPLDEAAVRRIAVDLRDAKVEAVAVCLLWSIADPSHELRVGELLREELGDLPVTLSHALNPVIREYRRASSAAIDASLKPLMATYLGTLEARLRGAGFAGRLLITTSSGGVLDAADMARAPIHALNSGPAMAPIAGRDVVRRAGAEQHGGAVIVADTGGTSYDATLIRRGEIPRTREVWLGTPRLGHMTGFPSVDVRSIGAGGGSVAWVDDGGLLRVGPHSAGSTPGPVAYGRGGAEPTVTDACLALGWLDADYFLGGTMALDGRAAVQAIDVRVAAPLGLSPLEAAAAIVQLATDHMARAIEELCIGQGVDPAEATLVGGGGAGGFNAVAIARRLGCARVIVPEVAPALSAAGAVIADVELDHVAVVRTSTADFDHERVRQVVDALRRSSREFLKRTAGDGAATRIDLFAEARYPHQTWDLEVPLDGEPATPEDVRRLEVGFHAKHREVFAVDDAGAPVDVAAVRARASVRRNAFIRGVRMDAGLGCEVPSREAVFAGRGPTVVPVYRVGRVDTSLPLSGPAIVEAPLTTVVIDGEDRFWVDEAGGVTVDLRRSVEVEADTARPS